MQIGNRFRCYPTNVQEKILLRWIGCQRFIYNAKVLEDRYFRSFACKSLTHTGQYVPIDQQYSHFKTALTPWLSEVPSVVLRNGATLWKQAYGRYFSKLGGRPTIHHKHGKQSVWLTSEVFKFKPAVDTTTGEVTPFQLYLGTKKFPIGYLTVKAHKAYKIPVSLHISIHAGRWYVSFNYDDGIPEPTDKETTTWLKQFNATQLREMTVGLDRGVTLPLATSDQQAFDFSARQKKRLSAQAQYRKRWQRRQARRTPGSARWLKAKRKVSRYQQYGADVRRDMAHKTSHMLAVDPRYKLFVFEALKIKNMTKKVKPKQDEQGRWMHNGARARSGLNKSILASTWGQTKVFLHYKARRQGKLVLEVSPSYSSQECATCGYIHSDNRVSQPRFVCQRCAHTDHADFNAAKVIAARGIQQLLVDKGSQKEKKWCGILRSKVGLEESKPTGAIQLPVLREKLRHSCRRWIAWTPVASRSFNLVSFVAQYIAVRC